MSRIFIILGIATTLMVSRGQVPIAVVNINSITHQSNVGRVGDMQLKVCYDTISDPGTIETRTLDIAVKMDNTGKYTNVRYLELTGLTETNCFFFKGDISAYKGKEVTFILQAHDISDAPLIYGKAIFQLPENFIEEAEITAHMVGKRNDKAATDSLRLSGPSLAGWNVCDTKKRTPELVTLKCTDAGNKIPPCYAIEIGAGGTYSLCISEKDIGKDIGNAKLFSTTITPQLSTTESEPEGILLEYGVPAKITMITSSITEFVAYTDKGNVYNIATVPSTGCSLDGYVESKKTINILFVKDDGDTVTSNIIQFEDYGIKGAYLGDTILEVYWKRESGDEHKFFGASISDDDGATVKETVVVDCSLVDPEHSEDPVSCFGYFINLDFSTATASSYLIKVAPNTLNDVNYEPILNNQIIETISHTVKDSHAMLMGIKLQQDPSYPDGVLQVCFKAPEVNHNNTRLEAIIIDEDGHWIKLYQSTKGQTTKQCFSPVDLLASSLRMKKDAKLTVVIVERDLRNLQVLASGQADIELSEFRVIKPETDNSSEGYMNTFTIVGAAIGGIACLVALVAATILFVMKRKKINDGLQYPLHRNKLEDSNIIPGLDNPNSTI